MCRGYIIRSCIFKEITVGGRKACFFADLYYILSETGYNFTLCVTWLKQSLKVRLQTVSTQNTIFPSRDVCYRNINAFPCERSCLSSQLYPGFYTEGGPPSHLNTNQTWTAWSRSVQRGFYFPRTQGMSHFDTGVICNINSANVSHFAKKVARPLNGGMRSI